MQLKHPAIITLITTTNTYYLLLVSLSDSDPFGVFPIWSTKMGEEHSLFLTLSQ